MQNPCYLTSLLPTIAPPRPIPHTAFGFVLDDDFRRRWAQRLLDSDENRNAPELKPFSEESLLDTGMLIVISVIADEVYAAVPSLPRLQDKLLPVKERGVLIPRHYVFVLSEHKGLSPTPENVELVRKALGLADDVEPAWVPIERYVGNSVFGGRT